MTLPSCRCPRCGHGLDATVRWARLLTEEPEVLEFPGPWGAETYVVVDGAGHLDVRCPRCGEESTVGRYWPVVAT